MNTIATLRREALRLDASTVFRSNDAQDMRDKVALAICPHKLEVSGASIQGLFRSAAIGDLSLLLLRYGTEVAVQTVALDGFVLLCFILSGEVEFSFNNKQVIAHAGDVVISETLEGRKFAWSADCEQLIVPVSRAAFAQGTEAITGNVAPRHFGLTPCFSLTNLAGESLIRLMQYMLLQATSGPASAAALDTPLTCLLAHHLLLNYSEKIGQKPRPSSRKVPYFVRQAETFITENVKEQISLGMIAKHVQVSERTLIAAFRQHKGTSPIAMLRDVRLERARAQLLDRRGSSVTEVALRFGFNHIGRFAADYRKRFGENPGITVARVRESASAYI